MKIPGCYSISSVLAAFLLCLTPLAAQERQEGQGQTVLAATRQVTTILNTVKDAATAQAAKPGLQQATESLVQAVQALQTTKRKGDAMSKRSGGEMDAAHEKFLQALGKVKKLEPARKELEPILNTLSQF